MKYIIGGDEFNEVVVIGNRMHVFLAEAGLGEHRKPRSAGHMHIVNGKVEVYGESIGFGIKSKLEDAELLGRYLGINNMTRGTLFVFLPSYRLVGSVEFNGDMYGSTIDSVDDRTNGHYKEVIEKMVSVEDENTFNQAVITFNKNNHDYDGQMTFEEDVDEYKNVDEQYRVKKCLSDYTFWKNCSGRKIELIDSDGVIAELRDGEIVTFYYGKYIEMFYPRSETWPDMFKRFEIA